MEAKPNMALTKRWWITFLVVLILVPAARGQTGGTRLLAKTEKPAARATTTTEEEVQVLRETLAAQHEEIEELKSTMQRLLQMMQQTTAARAPGNGQLALTGAAGNAAASNAAPGATPESAMSGTTEAEMAARMQADEKRLTELEHPAQIHFRGVTITPGGFLAANTVFRLHNENADVLDTYGNVPFSGSANSRLSEFRFTARHSRLSLLFEGKIHDWKASGYYEMDFEGAAPTANEVQTNSFQPRIRQLWAQVEMKNGFSFQGGQAWSLLTSNRRGISPTTLFIPLTLSASYNVGHTYARQAGFRVTKNFNEKAWLAFAVENPETVLSVINPPSNVLGFATSANATSPNNGFTLSNVPGAAGTSTDLGPDLIAKVAFEPGWGHYEIKALGRFFRDRLTGNTNVTGGGGLGVGIFLPVIAKKFDLVIQGLGGRGIGRYGTANGSDVTLRPDATIVPLLSYQTLIGLELHPTPKWDLWLYGGNEYFGRAAYTTTSGTTTTGVGYGSPLNNLSGCNLEVTTLSCNAQNRDVWQIQPGFWYRIWKAKEGTVQYGMSYSYVHRRAWAGTVGTSVGVSNPVGINNIVMTSLRYYLP
jgi:hypothetical protein